MELVPLSFLDLELKSDYDSENDDIVRQFYVPVLSKAKSYRRLAGFFSSSALAVAARGISAFVGHDGTMELLVGARLRKADAEAITEGKDESDRIISESMLSQLTDIEDEIMKDHVRALAWLVAKGHLDIRVAVVLDREGRPIDYETAMRRGMFHQKVGVFEDAHGNMISFSGSVNESATAWEDNIEEFKVFRNWIEGEVHHLASDNRKFERYWHGQTSRLRICDVPTAVREKLLELAPDDIRSLRLELSVMPRLRDYQEQAIAAWLGNAGRGILEMATGTGKTFAALGCAAGLLKSNSRLVIVITCPFTHLIRQWKENLKRFGLSCYEAFADSQAWTDRLTNSIFDFNNGSLPVLVIVTTHDTFSSQKFADTLGIARGPILLIADEVHGLGSPIRRQALLDIYDYRLGLSATPTRWFDEEGTSAIRDFFGRTVFEFTLDQAIEHGVLCKYEYHPYFVELDAHEMEQYRELTRRIAQEYSNAKDDVSRRELYELYCISRQKIVINATNKYETFSRILDSLGDPHHCLVYCSPQQIDRVQGILNSRGIVQHKFTAHENAKERKGLLESFANGRYKVLVAMRCLDEGLDVPSTRVAIVMASSTNPREFIQRRGRILRLNEGKDRAVVYDIIVAPTLEGKIDPDYYALESQIMRKELDRYSEFAKSAVNSGLAYSAVAKIASKYHITIEGDA